MEITNKMSEVKAERAPTAGSSKVLSTRYLLSGPFWHLKPGYRKVNSAWFILLVPSSWHLLTWKALSNHYLLSGPLVALFLVPCASHLMPDILCQGPFGNTCCQVPARYLLPRTYRLQLFDGYLKGIYSLVLFASTFSYVPSVRA
jgi:hypothetical protein